MSDAPAKIPVKVEVNESDKTAIILIPWHQLSEANIDVFRDWWNRAAKAQKEWEARGFKCT
jgi:hypothetical protein